MVILVPIGLVTQTTTQRRYHPGAHNIIWALKGSCVVCVCLESKVSPGSHFDLSHPLHSMSSAAAIGSAPLMSGTRRAMSSLDSHSRREARSKSSTASTAVSERRTEAPL